MPILTLLHRVHELGRIRFGKKGDKGQPQKLTTFRFTSFDKSAIEQAARLWGGMVIPCTEKELQGQWEVTTSTSEIPFYASPAQPSQYMESWSGGGCQRRCDGCTELLSGEPCLCQSSGEEICKPTTRLPVVLPDLPGVGVWRIESKGWSAAAELLPTFEMLQRLAMGREHVEAILALEARTGKTEINGKVTTTKFVVPVVRVPHTIRQLLAQSPLITQPTVIEPAAAPLPPASHVLKEPNPRGAVFALCHEMGLPPYEDYKEMFRDVFGKVIGVKIGSMSELNDAEWTTLRTWLHEVKNGVKKMPKAFEDFLKAAAAEGEYDPFSDDPNLKGTQ